MEIDYKEQAIKDLKFWEKHNNKKLRKILSLIEDIAKHPKIACLGKPKRLKGDYTGCCSRRINKKHRLIYKISENKVTIIACILTIT